MRKQATCDRDYFPAVSLLGATHRHLVAVFPSGFLRQAAPGYVLRALILPGFHPPRLPLAALRVLLPLIAGVLAL